MREHSRRSDFLARIGGEEFAVILPEADSAGAVMLGHRFRKAIDLATWPRRHVTVSVGAATVGFATAVPRPVPPARSQVLAAADRALYCSKERGRNCVTHVDEVTAGDTAVR